MLLPPGSQLVFDQVLWKASGTGSAFAFASGLSDPKFNDWLGYSDDIRLVAVVSRVTGTINFPAEFALTVQMQETSDEESAWLLTYGSEGVVIVGLVSTSGETVLSGSDTEAARGRPSVGFRRLYVRLNGHDTDTFSARIRIWAARRDGCRKFNTLLFKDRIEGFAPVYTPDSMAACFAEVDRLAIGVLTEEVTGSGPTLSVQAEESANGQTWTPMQQTLEIDDASIGDASDALKFHVFGIAGTLPPSGRVRFRIWLGAS